MLKELLTRLRQGSRTMKYPRGEPPALSDRFRGLPRIDTSKCPAPRASPCASPCARECATSCPTGAIDPETRAIDLGKCLFCVDCAEACPARAIEFTGDWRLAADARENLVWNPERPELRLAREMAADLKRTLGRSLKLRVVSAGGCGACEADVNVLNTIGWDLGRFGISYVASPRHADGILVTGPVTANMRLALLKTWDAIPEPKIAVAVGACAVSGAHFAALAPSGEAAMAGLDSILPVDLFVPGCPPHPLTILDGLLRLTGKLREN